MLFIILGSDRALAKQALDHLLGNIAPNKLEIDWIDAANSSSDAIFAAATAAPFFGSQRVIVLSGLLTQIASKVGRAGKGKSDNDLARLVGSLPESTSLVLFDPELGELGTNIRKQLPPDVSIAINDAPRGNALIHLARQLASRHETKLEDATARTLLERLFPGSWQQASQNRAFDKPPSTELIESEISKLALASYPGSISVEIIDDLVPLRIEERVFPLLDAVTSGNQRGSILETQNALRAGEDPSRTIAQLYQQIELMVGAVAPGRPADPLQAGRALGVASAFRLGKLTEAGQRARVAPARQLRMALDVDRKLKSGRLRNPDEALVDLVVRVTQTQENR